MAENQPSRNRPGRSSQRSEVWNSLYLGRFEVNRLSQPTEWRLLGILDVSVLSSRYVSFRQSLLSYLCMIFLDGRVYLDLSSRILILRNQTGAPACLPCRPILPFVGSVASGLFSHEGISEPSGLVLADVHRFMSIDVICSPLSTTSIC